MPDILIRGMCKLESGKSYRALFKELNGKFVIVVELVESYADREVEIYPVAELPPHGDLIDIRTVLEIIMQYVPDDDGSCSKANADLRELLDAIENAPAVVPAEREGTE